MKSKSNSKFLHTKKQFSARFDDNIMIYGNIQLPDEKIGSIF